MEVIEGWGRGCQNRLGKVGLSVALLGLVALFYPSWAGAEEASKLDTGDTAWVLISSALVS